MTQHLNRWGFKTENEVIIVIKCTRITHPKWQHTSPMPSTTEVTVPVGVHTIENLRMLQLPHALYCNITAIEGHSQTLNFRWAKLEHFLNFRPSTISFPQFPEFFHIFFLKLVFQVSKSPTVIYSILMISGTASYKPYNT